MLRTRGFSSGRTTAANAGVFLREDQCCERGGFPLASVLPPMISQITNFETETLTQNTMVAAPGSAGFPMTLKT